jgi:hypothetical protein
MIIINHILLNRWSSINFSIKKSINWNDDKELIHNVHERIDIITSNYTEYLEYTYYYKAFDSI